jgi:hypothetical protein
MRIPAGILAAGLMASACSDGTGPRGPASPVTVVFVDSTGHASVMRSDSVPSAISSLDAMELFASADDAVLAYKQGRMSIFRFSDPVPRPFEDREESAALITRGALSADGKRLAYATGLDANIFIHTVDITTGARDSINVANKGLDAAPQIIFSVPIWSPDAKNVAFLLPNFLGMQVLLYERSTRRLEVKPIAIPSSTFFEVLDGRPQWSSNGTIRFLARRKADGIMFDTLVVLQIDPEQALPQSAIAYKAVPPDSLAITGAWSYSFSRDGKTAAFGMSTGGRAAIMVMRQGRSVLETLLYADGAAPADLVLIP